MGDRGSRVSWLGLRGIFRPAATQPLTATTVSQPGHLPHDTNRRGGNVCYYRRQVLVFLRGLVDWDDWEGDLKRV